MRQSISLALVIVFLWNMFLAPPCRARDETKVDVSIGQTSGQEKKSPSEEKTDPKQEEEPVREDQVLETCQIAVEKALMREIPDRVTLPTFFVVVFDFALGRLCQLGN